jgi:hypothetical protein
MVLGVGNGYSDKLCQVSVLGKRFQEDRSRNTEEGAEHLLVITLSGLNFKE